MEGAVRAIETRYAGCHFRSRLEARWAVFFDTLGVKWQYEEQGFIGHGETPYLPDFYLPDVYRFGDLETPGRGVYVEVKGTDDALFADGAKIANAIDYQTTPVHTGLLLLGEVPRIINGHGLEVLHCGLYWHEGVQAGAAIFDVIGDHDHTVRLRWQYGWWGYESTAPDLPEDATTRAVLRYTIYDDGNGRRGREPSAKLIAAYEAARSARFEHGRSGA